jgi:hypothetical protein
LFASMFLDVFGRFGSSEFPSQAILRKANVVALGAFRTIEFFILRRHCRPEQVLFEFLPRTGLVTAAHAAKVGKRSHHGHWLRPQTRIRDVRQIHASRR